MKNLLLVLGVLFVASFALQAQTIEFSDDFEAGAGNWTLEGAWGITSTQANSGTNSLTDSPAGNYAASQNISATLTTGIDLSAALDASLSFFAIYDIENGNFDYCYVEASANGGAWLNVATIFGEGNLSPWTQYTYSLGGFVGNNDVKVRFRFFSDGGYEVDGIYIDDVVISSSNEDNAAPFILHTPPTFYASVQGDVVMSAELVDVSGVASSTLSYQVDGVAAPSVTGMNTVDNTYTFTIPEEAAGSQIDYTISVTDNSPNNNTATTSTFSYIAGNHVIYDNSQVDFVNSFGPDAQSLLSGCAVRFTLFGADIKYALIRNYTDPNRPNSDFEFHVWANEGGLPGADLITPFMVTPEATLMNTSPMTRVDLRDYSAELSAITGDVFVGFVVPTGQTWLTQSTPAVGNRTYNFNGTTWSLNDDDYHFRIVTTASTAADDCADATDLSSLTGGGPNNTLSSPLFDNTDATVGGEPTTGTDCFDDGTFHNTQWYTFVGDGLAYNIKTSDCGSTNYISDGDTQMAIYSGDDCGNLIPVACNEDEDFPNDLYNASIDFQTEAGVTYYILIDGWNGSIGEYCVQFTEIAFITCADIAIGAASTDTELVCLGDPTSFNLAAGTVIPQEGPVNGFRWVVSSADISGSANPLMEASYLGAFGVVTNVEDIYTPALVNDGTQLPAGNYYFTPIVYGGATGTFPALDLTDGCIATGTSVLVTLLPTLPVLNGTVVSSPEITPPGGNGSASVNVITGGSENYSYQWSNGATTSTITDLTAGDYSVTVSDLSGCVDPLVLTVTVDVTVGVDDAAFVQTLRIFPNPAKDLATISYSFEESKQLQIKVTNTIGQVVWLQQAPTGPQAQVNIDLSNFANGVYFIEFNDGEQRLSRRLVVNK
ncbi:T9SS type A sorting domain-containing protein [Lewinella sp. LCG006]|uniref:T9SS type A sorting domain-containing protein n=1 Tax=Lewinella sp. LCG006 TaxID=3231911 RepID=UPI003460C429